MKLSEKFFERIVNALTTAILVRSRGLLNKTEACEWLGGISVEQLNNLADQHVVKIGHSNYYKPEDLLEIRNTLPYGRQS